MSTDPEDSEPRGPLEPEEPIPSVHMVEDEHKQAIAAQRRLENSIRQLPDFMDEVTAILKQLPTQKDIDTTFETKIREYDTSLKAGLNEIIGKIGQRMEQYESRLSTQPANEGGWGGFFKPLIEAGAKAFQEGKIQIPGITTFGVGANEAELQAVNSVFINQMKRVQRDATIDWLNKLQAAPPAKQLGMVVLDAQDTGGALIH